ncbi:MAG: type III PLP-dependent enzyme [bacterium]|nr:type III PLP-dependent enzyme [bacterium]
MIQFDPEFLDKVKYETPFFIFSKKKIINNYKTFEKLFPKAHIFYAMKANFEPEILKILSDEGSGFEVASMYELDMLKAAKVPPEKIIYGTSVKPLSHIKSFHEYGVTKFAFDSLGELEKIAAAAPGASVYVRTIVNDSASVFKFSEKFGTDMRHIAGLLHTAADLGLDPYGISFNVGSQSSNLKAWGDAICELVPIIKELDEAGIRIKAINIGGGFPCQYGSSQIVPELIDIAEYTASCLKKLPYEVDVMMEPGRGIVGNTGLLITSVIARVQKDHNTWLFLDAGVFNALFEALAYQGSTRYPISCTRTKYDVGEKLFALAGPTGDSTDIITREALLPKDIDVGDRVIIHNVGAYTLTASSNFNGFPKPSVYYI